MGADLHADAGACPVCGAERHWSFQAELLGRHDVAYFLCNRCGLLQCEPPYWLDEAYADAIAASDTGLLARNLDVSARLVNLLYTVFGPRGKYMDVAGGYGVLVRLMRDAGFEFYWQDRYCRNLFASGFEYDGTRGPLDAVTGFEVFEHVTDPVGFARTWLEASGAKTLIFTTELFSGAPPAQDWWYYAFETGQHISFYQRKTLEFIAAELGLRLLSYRNWHMMTDRAISPRLFRLLVSRPSAWHSKVLSRYVRARMKAANAMRRTG